MNKGFGSTRADQTIIAVAILGAAFLVLKVFFPNRDSKWYKKKATIVAAVIILGYGIIQVITYFLQIGTEI